MAENLEDRVGRIEDRNQRVELDKAWEISLFRRVLISILTYLVVAMFFLFTNNDQPFLDAIVPTMGFLLSTLAVERAKRFWIKRKS